MIAPDPTVIPVSTDREQSPTLRTSSDPRVVERPSITTATRDADPRHPQPRLDTVVTTLVERQVEAVLAGIAVAALHSGPADGADGSGWLARELEIAVRLTRVATAAGVVLPAALATFTPQDREVSRRSHLVRSRSRYEAIGDVFTRLVAEGVIPEDCAQDARTLLGEVDVLLDQIARDVPDPVEAKQPRRYLPGELLG